jgi:N-acetyl-gamma-glutamyl-phosphate reductase
MKPFVDVLPPGSHPDTRSVRAANTCRIAVHRPQDGNVLVVLAVIDNLVKGAAGQAVQNHEHHVRACRKRRVCSIAVAVLP